MSQVSIELFDGPRKGGVIKLNNVWKYPDEVVVPYKDASGVMRILTYKRHVISNPNRRSRSAQALISVYKYVEGSDK